MQADRSFSTPPSNTLYDAWIDQSHAMVTILTPAMFTRNHINDAWFWREVERGINFNIPIVTIFAYGLTVPADLPSHITSIVRHLSRQPKLQVSGEQRLNDELGLLHAIVMSLQLPIATPFVDSAEAATFEQMQRSTAEAAPTPTDAQLGAERLLNLGLVAAHQRDFATAAEMLMTSIDAFPDYYNAYNSRAVARAIMGDLEGALSDLSHCIELDSKNFRAFSNRGNVYMRLEQTDEALLDYSKAIDLSPHSSIHYNNRGFARYHLGDFRGAVDDCSEAILINPQAFDAFDSRGFSYYGLGDYESALKDFQRVMQIRSDYVESMVGLAITYHALGDIGAAHDAWKGVVVAEGTDDIKVLAGRFLWTTMVREAIEKLTNMS